jgi:hypothetical protein
MSDYEGGIGTFGTESVYWDMNKDRTTNVFPGGVPGAVPHDHYVVNEETGEVEYMRIDGEVTMDSRNYDD